MSKSPLIVTLRDALNGHAEGPLCVGFSGGPDSTALLHTLSTLPEARARGLRAVHVDHGLHAHSDQWATHCETFCATHKIRLDVHHVQVDRRAGLGLEAAARVARYAVFADILACGENLLLAHHRDDQAETVLLKLLRGAGPQGLGGMRVRRPFSGGWLWRPLLDLPRDALAAHVKTHALACIDDPGNRTTRQSRNFLRVEIVPRLREHWPQATQALAHSARLHRAAADYIDAQSRVAVDGMRDIHGSLDASAWLALHETLRGPVLELWLHGLGLPAPGLAQAAQLRRQVRDALPDKVPCVRWPGAEVHRWRGRLYAHKSQAHGEGAWIGAWQAAELVLPTGGGSLRWSRMPTQPPPPLQVRLGETGVRLRPADDRHTRDLRDLFQQAAVPPWLRRGCPLIYDAEGTLLAVADLWRTHAGDALFKTLDAEPVWQPTR